ERTPIRQQRPQHRRLRRSRRLRAPHRHPRRTRTPRQRVGATRKNPYLNRASTEQSSLHRQSPRTHRRRPPQAVRSNQNTLRQNQRRPRRPVIRKMFVILTLSLSKGKNPCILSLLVPLSLHQPKVCFSSGATFFINAKSLGRAD